MGNLRASSCGDLGEAGPSCRRGSTSSLRWDPRPPLGLPELGLHLRKVGKTAPARRMPQAGRARSRA